MSTLPLPELAQEMAAFNCRIAESVEAEIRRVEKTRLEMENQEALQRKAGRSAREALQHTLRHAADAQAVWLAALESVKEGLSVDDLKKMLGDVQSVAGTWLTLAEKTRELWKLAAAEKAPDKLDELAKAEAKMREIIASAQRMYSFATRKKPAVDPALLQKARKAIESGKAKTPEQMRSRLGGANA